MHAARTSMHRIVASLVLAALAVFAVLSSAHAGLHAAGHSHGTPQLSASHIGDHQASSEMGEATEKGDASALPDAPDCSLCHAVVSGLEPSLAPGLILPTPAQVSPALADALPSSTRPEGLRRPPRHL